MIIPGLGQLQCSQILVYSSVSFPSNILCLDEFIRRFRILTGHRLLAQI